MSKISFSRLAFFASIALLSACGSGRQALPPAPTITTQSAPELQSMSTSMLSTTPLMTQAQTKIGPFQVFDAFGTPRITAAEATADASRYGIVWGARPEMVAPWKAGNPNLLITYYMPQPTDPSSLSWGAIGHTLTWWKANHPDWILYTCLADGTPTTTPAYWGSLPTNVPLDFHNPEVVAYQMRTAAAYAKAYGYNGLAIDEVLFYNAGGESVGTGAYGCGIYQNGSFVRRYSGRSDPQWAADVVAWVKAAHALLATDPTLSLQHLKLVVNHPAGNIANPNEQAILSNVDADLDETGYSSYGGYAKSSVLFKIATDWARYAQAHGVAPLIINKFYQSAPLTPTQREYAIATYLMANEGGMGSWMSNSAPGYGIEQYVSEYSTNYGTRCGSYYGGTLPSPHLWYRRYSNAFVVVNSGSSTAEVASLPSGHTYHDLEGRAITLPLSVASHDAYVLLTTNGCY